MSTKNFLQSKTLLGILIAAIPAIAGLFGVSIDQSTAAMIGDTVSEAANHIDSLIQLAGLLLATYGRIKAQTALVVK